MIPNFLSFIFVPLFGVNASEMLSHFSLSVILAAFFGVKERAHYGNVRRFYLFPFVFFDDIICHFHEIAFFLYQLVRTHMYMYVYVTYAVQYV